MNLLILLHNDEHLMSLLSKVLDIPQLSEHNALSEFLSQFEAAIDSDFPKYQVSFFQIAAYDYFENFALGAWAMKNKNGLQNACLL